MKSVVWSTVDCTLIVLSVPLVVHSREGREGVDNRVSIADNDSLSLFQGTGGAPAVRITGSQPVNDKKSGGCC